MQIRCVEVVPKLMEMLGDNRRPRLDLYNDSRFHHEVRPVRTHTTSSKQDLVGDLALDIDSGLLKHKGKRIRVYSLQKAIADF